VKRLLLLLLIHQQRRSRYSNSFSALAISLIEGKKNPNAKNVTETLHEYLG